MPSIALGKADDGTVIRISLTDSGVTDDNGNPIYLIGTDTTVNVGAITVGNVKVQDGDGVSLADVGADTGLAIGSLALAVHDPEVGQITDTLANGTVIGLLSHLAKGNPSLGVGGAAVQSADASAAPIAVTDAPGVGKNLAIQGLIISSDTTNMVLTFTEETSGAVKLVAYMPSGGVFSPLTGNNEITLPLANKRLMVQASKAGNIAVTALWHID